MRVQGGQRCATIPGLVPRTPSFSKQQSQPHVQVILPPRLAVSHLLDVASFVVCNLEKKKH